jgi:hypothetical protein
MSVSIPEEAAVLYARHQQVLETISNLRAVDGDWTKIQMAVEDVFRFESKETALEAFKAFCVQDFNQYLNLRGEA